MKRLILELDDKAESALEQMARTLRQEPVDVVREALVLYEVAVRQAAEGRSPIYTDGETSVAVELDLQHSALGRYLKRVHMGIRDP